MFTYYQARPSVIQIITYCNHVFHCIDRCNVILLIVSRSYPIIALSSVEVCPNLSRYTIIHSALLGNTLRMQKLQPHEFEHSVIIQV